MVRLLTKHFWVINLVSIAAAAWLVAHISGIVIRDRLTTYPMPTSPKSTLSTAPEKSEPYERYAPITERNIFNPSEKGLKLLPLVGKEAGGKDGAETPEGGKPVASVSYKLVGTIIGPEDHSWAVLQEGATRKQRVVPIHGSVDGGKIVRISRTRISIQRDGKEEILNIFEEGGQAQPKGSTQPQIVGGTRPPTGEVVRKLSANRYVVNREDVSSSVSNINQFMTQARIKPNFVAGRPSGFSVSEIQGGSLMEKLGLQNNDVVRKVNGQSIDKPEDIFQAYSQLQRDSNIELEIERGGRREVLRYEIR
jgi:general secretion pathway protein C